MKIIKLTEKSVDKMYGVAEMLAETAEAFMDCLDGLEAGHREEPEDGSENYGQEYPHHDMDSGNRYDGPGYHNMGDRGQGSSGFREMGNQGGSGYRRGYMGHRGEIADRRGVKGTGRYSRY